MAKKSQIYKNVEKLFLSLGGHENIQYFTHCMTRMRFHLHDWDKANENEIKDGGYAVGVNKNKSNGEFQVIIGPEVESFYNAFCEVNGYDEDGKTLIAKNDKPNLTEEQNKEIVDMKNRFRVKGSFNKVLSFISKVFAPIVIPLVGYGLILTIASLITVEWSGSDSSLAANSHFFKEFSGILSILVNSFSLFVTVAVGYTTAKALRCNGIYGIIIALVLTSPGLINMGDVKPADGQSILGAYEGWTLFGDGVKYPWKINFNGLIIPMIVVVSFGAFLEIQTNKIKQSTLKMIIQPIAIIGGGFLFGVFIVAPVGLLFTNYLSIGINWLSTNSIAKYIAIPVVGGLYGPLVITGLHHSLTPIILQGQAIYGATLIQGFCTISNVSQGVASIAFVVLHRRVSKMKDIGVSNGVSAIVGGITEPSLYTINLKHLFPLIGCSIGTFFGTMIMVASNSYALQGASSIFGILMFLQQAPEKTGATTWIGGGYLWGTISVLTSCIITFVATYSLGKTKYFWNRSREILLNDFHEDINELKLLPKTKKAKRA
ncbi:hypothetical protein CG006_02355 [Mesoplasma florum]|uniref:PTS transporter subunit EIIB n=1 Tax=Mesoplasma florum TaxID=2151 RepID=UPI000D0375E8|nr:PTS transporter subunit EIIB [Mesoplasma florum]AVN63809.1 hypothetical protein CG006_02355 [Mesoplasma florum]